VIALLKNNRLDELSVLITNFSEPPVDQHDRYSHVMTEYFRYRYNDLPKIFWDLGVDPAVGEHDPSGYVEEIGAHLGDFYSEFVTRLVVDLARWLIPSVRAISSGAVLRAYSSELARRQSALARAIGPETIRAQSIEDAIAQLGDTQLSPSSYPVLSFLRSLKRWNPTEPLIATLLDWNGASDVAQKQIEIAACLDKIIEGHWELGSDDLINALRQSWFDRSRPYTCDIPMPNLLINSLLGIYGYPHFRSATASYRYSYVAKTNRMYLDVFAFDRCRSFFDWFPTIHQVPQRFASKSFQIVARCLLDRISACDANSDSNPFRGATVAGYYDLNEAPFHFLSPRQDAGGDPSQ
jgi:hypothetical protein